ncbi:hypothetical protein EV1_039920 [Malus domestica]
MVVQNAQPHACPLFRITYQKPYPEYIDEQNLFPLNFKMPAFPTFSGEYGSVSFRDHIFKFFNHCVAFEDNPNYKLRLFGNSLVGLASQWMKPKMFINDLVEVKQYEHESIEDFMIRFRMIRMRCQFPINHAQLISIAQKALRLPLRKKFYDVQFNELQELVIAATKYEKLLLKE